ncbi:MAG: InlB B-repeat-containing protein, partial [Methanomassiliicoccaceae archaeon]|nr:InlB B-repeat-containing protein [Methanomassiliicoccaceae archaeon]
ATVTMPASAFTLYAIWESYRPYAVTYDLNTGTGSAPMEPNKAAGEIFSAAPATGMTPPAGMQFKHWNASADGSGTVYTTGAPVTMPSGGITLYAIWEYVTYEVKYIIVNGTWGGSSVEVTETVTHGQTLANIPTNMTPGAAYTPTGGSWGTPAPATSTVVTSAMVFTYTYETMKTYEVTLTPGTGYTLTTSSSTTVTHGGSFTFSFALAADYSNSSFSVFVNDEKITIADGGGYTIPDITGTTTVRVEGVERNVHNFISVPQTSWVKGSAGNFVMTVDTTSVFNDLWMNNVKLTKGTHYTVTSGSTVITILSSYLETLTAGPYSIVAEFVDGAASASLLISAPSGDGGDETGDEEGGDGGGIDMMIIIAIVAVIAIVGIGAVFFLMKKK